MLSMFEELYKDSKMHNFVVIRVDIKEDEGYGTAIIEHDGIPERLAWEPVAGCWC